MTRTMIFVEVRKESIHLRQTIIHRAKKAPVMFGSKPTQFTLAGRCPDVSVEKIVADCVACPMDHEINEEVAAIPVANVPILRSSARSMGMADTTYIERMPDSISTIIEALAVNEGE